MTQSNDITNIDICNTELNQAQAIKAFGKDVIDELDAENVEFCNELDYYVTYTAFADIHIDDCHYFLKKTYYISTDEFDEAVKFDNLDGLDWDAFDTTYELH